MDENNEIKGLLLPPEHLQDLIDKMDAGVEVAMSDLERLEVKKYMKILSSQLFDDDDRLPSVPPTVAAFQRQIHQCADMQLVKRPADYLDPPQREQRSDEADNQDGQRRAGQKQRHQVVVHLRDAQPDDRVGRDAPAS